MKSKNFISVLCKFILLAGLVAATVEWTTTGVNFNIASAIEFQVTLPGESNATSANTGTATTAIEFNSTTGGESDVNPKVVGTSEVQADGTPIFIVFNTGTVGIQLNMSLDATTETCYALKYGTSWATKGDTELTTANATIAHLVAITGTTDIYLETDFTACTGSDTGSNTIYLFGYNES